MKAIPNMPLNIVDVRDVADLHIHAMTNPKANGQRFIASAGGKISMPEIALLLKNKMPDVAKKVSTRTLPNWVLHFAALFNEQAKGCTVVKCQSECKQRKSKESFGLETYYK